jgi:5,10-methylenetetrahydromethanopterin reductase
LREVGIGLAGSFRPREYAELATAAEAAGFDVFTVFGDLMFHPPVLALLVAAQATSRLRLGPTAINPYTTHPVEIAGQVAFLDAASAGRAYLGLARGAWLERLGVAQPRPLAALRDAAEIVRLLLAGDAAGYRGQVFSVGPGLRLRAPLERSRVPLLLGGWGPRAMALAGEVADELKVGGSANPAMVALARSALDGGAARASRAPGSTVIVMGAVTIVDEDGERARRRARTEVAMYLDVVAGLDRTQSIDPELLTRLHDLVAAGRDEEAGRLVPDQLLDMFAMAGTPERVAARAAELFDAGAGRVEFGPPLGLDGPLAGLDLMARRVLPALR